ncbi:MAG: hypothetical protein K2G03_02900 [Bacilli bacterium]|nr:hypothetical protein [Bacilli bacterium]
MNELIEEYRKLAVNNLFSVESFSKVWPIWKNKIDLNFQNRTVDELTELGAHLSEIFKSTSKGRNQSSVSAGGTAWENLVCWYLNLCSIGSRTVIVRPVKNVLPDPIKNAITVNYGNFTSNTEADIIAITFFEKDDDYYEIIKSKTIVDKITDFITYNFDKLEINIIQCKTNWNDNAQIPMLWDMIYKVKHFENNNISIGKNNFSIKDCKSFSYSFVTVPTVKLENIKPNSVAVKRVANLSGGV